MGSMTKQQRRKQAKAKNRQKRISKEHNIRQNEADKRYRLDVKIDGQWRIGVKSFSYMYQVEAHRIDTERRRVKGEEIVPGQVGDLVTGKIVLKIDGSSPVDKLIDGMKGQAPDKFRDGSKAADVSIELKTISDDIPTATTI